MKHTSASIHQKFWHFLSLFYPKSHRGTCTIFWRQTISTRKTEKETARTLWQVDPRADPYDSAIQDVSLFLNSLGRMWADNFSWDKHPNSATKAHSSFTQTGCCLYHYRYSPVHTQTPHDGFVCRGKPYTIKDHLPLCYFPRYLLVLLKINPTYSHPREKVEDIFYPTDLLKKKQIPGEILLSAVLNSKGFSTAWCPAYHFQLVQEGSATTGWMEQIPKMF